MIISLALKTQSIVADTHIKSIKDPVTRHQPLQKKITFNNV